MTQQEFVEKWQPPTWPHGADKAMLAADVQAMVEGATAELKSRLRDLLRPEMAGSVHQALEELSK
jgi:hypothetical protein